MRRILMAAALVASLSSTALGQDKPAPNITSPLPPPSAPDPNTPITVTLGELQLLLKQAQSQAIAESTAAEAKDALLKVQAQIAKPKPK